MTRQYVLVFVLILMILFVFSRESMEGADTSPAAAARQREKAQIGTYVKSMREGMIRGGLSSVIFGGYEGMIGNIVSQGLVNPLMKYIE